MAICHAQSADDNFNNQSFSSFVSLLLTSKMVLRLHCISGLLMKTVTLRFQTTSATTSIYQLCSNPKSTTPRTPGPAKPTQISTNISSSEASTQPPPISLDILDMTIPSTNLSSTRIDLNHSRQVGLYFATMTFPHAHRNLPHICRASTWEHTFDGCPS